MLRINSSTFSAASYHALHHEQRSCFRCAASIAALLVLLLNSTSRYAHDFMRIFNHKQKEYAARMLEYAHDFMRII
jgi:hypothetical protein